MKIPLPKMRAGDIEIEYQVSDYTDPWREAAPETILFCRGCCRVLRFNSRGCGGTTAPAPAAN